MADNLDGFLSPFLRERRLAAAVPHIRGSILDFGCGIGLLRGRFEGSEYVGVDVSPAALEEARRRFPQSRFLAVADMRELSGQRFDTVVALAVIEHLPDPVGFLREMKGHLNPGGRIVLTTPNPVLDWAHGLGGRIGLFARESHDEHQSLMNRAGIVWAAEQVGLRLIAFRRFLFGANQLAVLAPE